MKLAMEIPTKHLNDLSPLVDIDFLIPHKLESKDYREFYAERHNVECIMDNGYHELGHPITLDKLLYYYDMMEPDFLISPDKLDGIDWTLEMAGQLAKKVPRHKLAGNVFGLSHEIRMRMAEHYQQLGFGMICFPYRKRQISWFEGFDRELAMKADEFGSIHFLGAIDAEETEYIAREFKRASIDTAKPIKWGLQSEYLTNLKTWSGGWKEGYDSYSSASINTPIQEACINFNIAYLRKLIA